jgi:negative regulator of flagellin synthesis FlgM
MRKEVSPMIISGQQVQCLLKAHQAGLSKRKPELVVAEGKTDKLELSNYAKEFKIATDLVLKSPDIRVDRVSNLKKQIVEGNYQVSGDDIAVKMFDRSLVDEIARR